MTKKKVNKSHDGGGVAVAGAAAGATPATGGQIKSTNRAISLFPAKPARIGRAPGIEVRLITNLFKISLKQEKPIYRYTIEIDQVEQSSESDKGGGDKRAPGLPRKISKEVRQAAVKQAVEDWAKNNDRGNEVLNRPFSYVLDGNASTMFALFDMKLAPSERDQSKKKLEIIVTMKLPFCSRTGLVYEDKVFDVKFQDGFILKVRELMDYCSGKGTQDTERYKDHVRALNVIFLGEIVTIPNFLVSQSTKGSGLGTVFNYDARLQYPISDGVICNKGFNLSVRPTETGLVLNVANTVAPFLEPLSILDLLKRRFRVNDFTKNLSPFVRESLEKELCLKQIDATHINYGTSAKPHYRKYRVQNISRKSTKEETFEMDGKKISVYDYFKKEYPKVTLKFPNLPCIVDRGRMVPIEVCRVIDKQRVGRKLTPDETSAVIKKAALKPEFHFEDVKRNAQEVNKYNKSYSNFGLELDMKPIEVTGRELPQINLLGEKQMRATTQNGEYQNRGRFVKSASVPKWAILIILDDMVKRSYDGLNHLTAEGQRFSQMYAKAGFKKGVSIQPTKDVHTIAVEDDAAMKKKLTDYFEFLNSNEFVLCLAVLPNRAPDWTYSYLQFLEANARGKRKPDEARTRVSCVKFDNYLKKILNEQQQFKADMFLNNLWLKHNTKLGGVNIVLDGKQTFGIDPKTLTKFLDPNYLFVSIDVCHPAPGDRLKQSVAAAVGMWNITNPNMSYCTRMRAQRKEKSEKDKSTVEEVGQIDVMLADIIESYKGQTKNLPTHVVVLRDGVSEGQFKMVLHKELCQIKQVLYDSYSKLKVKEPLLSCLTVQKRHKVRMMRKDPVKDRRGNNDFNIQPGTVIDSQITTPNDFSFYLAPHKAIQGTARAPHIFMIYDEIKFTQDSAQAMIFALSYLSPRCTKGTSIPTPVNLADLAAERGKNLVVSWNEANSRLKLSDDERLVKLNAFLSNLGETGYKNTLFYI